jgi:Tfp pilus assembly protein PilF
MRTISVVIVATATVVGCSGHPFESFFSSGERYLTAKRYTEAAIEFQNAARINPESAAVQVRLGDAYSALNQPNVAAAAYQRACALNPGDAGACVKAAAKLLSLGDFDSAIAAARSALAADQYSLDAQLLLGSAFAGVRRFAEAEERLEAALALAPRDARPYRSLGNLQRQRGNVKAAEVWLRKSVERDPSSAETRVDLARLYMESGRTADGERELRAAVDVDPRDPDANEALARHLVATGRCDDAEQYWSQLAARSTDGSGALALADFYVSQNRYDDALGALRSVRAPGQEAAIDARVAAITYDRGDRAKAVVLIDQVLSRHQSSVDAMLLKARMALDQHDFAAARDYAHRAAATTPDAPAVRNMLAAVAEAAGPDR